MNEIQRFHFEGTALEFHNVNGAWWANADEAAELLGYSDKRQVLRLFARHASEFLPHEQGVVDLTTPGGIQQVRVFSPRGLEHLAILGRTSTCVRFRRWLLDEVLAKLDAGGRVLSAEHVAALRELQASLERQAALNADLVRRLAALEEASTAKDRRIDTLVNLAENLGHALSASASAAGRQLREHASMPEIAALERAYQQRHSGQGLLALESAGDVGGDAHEALKDRILETLRGTLNGANGHASAIAVRGAARLLAATLHVPRRYVRDALADLYLEGGIVRRGKALMAVEYRHESGLLNGNGNGSRIAGLGDGTVAQ